MKIFGFIPVRMAASRFPGKPLKLIKGKAMLEHVYERAKMYKSWKELFVTTCDNKIKKFSLVRGYKCIMTSKRHKRCLDRVFEAATKIKKIKNNDIVVCVQGDEPMLGPKMIEKVIKPFGKNKKIKATVLAMSIINKKQFNDKNIIKIVHNKKGEVLYTSRSPIPYYEKFTKKTNARRIGGIFAFKFSFLKKFFYLKSSPLENIEACDSNRICDNGGGMYIAPINYSNYFSVDTPKDLKLVNKYISKDPLYKKYK